MAKHLTKVQSLYKMRFGKNNSKHLFNLGKMQFDDINLMSNDYLCIANHPKIVNAMCDSLTKGVSASPFMSNVFDISTLNDDDESQGKCEKELSKHMNMESALLCQSGYMANVGVIQSITSNLNSYPFLLPPKITRDDVVQPVYIDSMAHASLHEGIVAGRAESFVFPHNNLKTLEDMIKQFGPGTIVVDSIYSTDGSICPLEQVVDIKSRTGSVIVVDESHSLGLYGENGGTLVSKLNLTDEVDFITASLSKAFACRAGLIGCSEDMKQAISFSSYPAIFSSALLPHDVAGIKASLEVIMESSEARKSLFQKSKLLREMLTTAGYNVLESESPIIALPIGDEKRAVKMKDYLCSQGIFGAPFAPPATRRKECTIRLTVNSGHTEQQLIRVAEVCGKARRVVLQNYFD